MEGPDQIFDASSYVTSDIDGKVMLRLDESTNEYPPMSLPSQQKKYPSIISLLEELTQMVNGILVTQNQQSDGDT